MMRTTTKAAATTGSSPGPATGRRSSSHSQSHSKVLLEEVFHSLEEATRLDKSGCHRIEAATKYYESCYLMRQIIAASQEEGENSSTITTTRHRLLEEKIDYYTKVAQRLYFDDTNKSVIGPPPPATSIIIGLLDDVVSVFTISHPLERPHYPTTTTTTLPQNRNNENGNDNDTEADYERLTGQSTALGTTRSNPSTLLQAINNVLPRGSSNSNGLLLKKQQQRQRQHNQKQQHQQRRRGSTTFAKDAAERKIHIRMNLANAKLGQAIDLDEHYYYYNDSDGNSGEVASCYERIIHSYVEASEFYLDAIKLAEEHQQNYPSQFTALSMSSKVDPWAMKVKSSSPSLSSSSPISTVIPKLKHLLISTLDRVETLKLKLMNMKKKQKSIRIYNRSRSAKAVGCGRYDRMMKDTTARPSASRLSL